MIEKDGKLNLKPIYFIINPLVYYIDKYHIEQFMDEVDRSSSITKLTGFMQSLNGYLYEVQFKYKTFKNNKDMKNMYEIDYKNIDIVNFCISLVINIILLLFLSKDDTFFSISNILITIISFLQILFNLYFLNIYYKSKYQFNVLKLESENSDKKMSNFDKLKLYVFDSFLFHEDTYFMTIIIILSLFCLFSDEFNFLYSLELLSACKLSTIITLVISAIITQMPKFLTIFGFLFILIYFYANISYKFLRDEFTIEIEDGVEENVCSSVLECTKKECIGFDFLMI